jgi:hypothetical protein
VIRLFPAFVFAGGLCLASCATEGPTPEELQEQVRRGVSGEGQVQPGIDRSGDPYVRPRGGPAPRRDL